MASVSFSCWDARVFICICLLHHPPPPATSRLLYTKLLLIHIWPELCGTSRCRGAENISAAATLSESHGRHLGSVCPIKYLRSRCVGVNSFDSHEYVCFSDRASQTFFYIYVFLFLSETRHLLTISGRVATFSCLLN